METFEKLALENICIAIVILTLGGTEPEIYLGQLNSHPVAILHVCLQIANHNNVLSASLFMSCFMVIQCDRAMSTAMSICVTWQVSFNFFIHGLGAWPLAPPLPSAPVCVYCIVMALPRL